MAADIAGDGTLDNATDIIGDGTLDDTTDIAGNGILEVAVERAGWRGADVGTEGDRNEWGMSMVTKNWVSLV
jgi:hypothetical protein